LHRKGYAIGAFSPRVSASDQACLARRSNIPNLTVIVQISQKEFERYQLTPVEFADEFFYQLLQQLAYFYSGCFAS
jgi:hypothetical protein